MKKLIDLKSIFFNIRRALYATMVIIIAVSIPVLSYVELSHEDENDTEKTTIMAKNGPKTNVVTYQ